MRRRRGRTQQVSPQGYCPSVIVRDDVRRAQTPMSKQVGEELALSVEGNAVFSVLRGWPVPGMSHRYTVREAASASAYGRQSSDDQGVTWQNTTSGLDPICSQRTVRPRQEERLSLSTGDMFAHAEIARRAVECAHTAAVRAVLRDEQEEQMAGPDGRSRRRDDVRCTDIRQEQRLLLTTPEAPGRALACWERRDQWTARARVTEGRRGKASGVGEVEAQETSLAALS